MPIHLRAGAGDYASACLLPGDPLRAKYIAETYLEDVTVVNEERGLLGYTGQWNGKPVSVQGTGMGCPGATIVFEELIQLGVKRLLRVGNAALEGASQALRSASRRRWLEETVKGVEHVRLETHPRFFDIFVDGCQFTRFGEAA